MPKMKITKEQIDLFTELAKIKIEKKQKEIKQLQGFIEKYRYDYEEGEE